MDKIDMHNIKELNKGVTLFVLIFYFVYAIGMAITFKYLDTITMEIKVWSLVAVTFPIAMYLFINAIAFIIMIMLYNEKQNKNDKK